MALLAVAASLPAPAQDTGEEIEVGNIHFAFATYLGSGIYSVEDRTAQVYRFPVQLGILSEEGRGWGLNLNVPFTLGFFDFKAEDVLIVGLPDRVSTLCLVPSLRAPIRLTREWNLTPNLDLGAAREFDQGNLVWVYGVGAQADAVYGMRSYDLRPLLRSVWAHHTGAVSTIGNDLAKFEAGLESRFPLPSRLRGQQLDLGVFAKYYGYLNELEIVQPGELPVDLTNQWEIGGSVGTRTPLRILGVKMPRVGLSYRFGERVGAIRIILGKPM